jgi:hypothetical protein
MSGTVVAGILLEESVGCFVHRWDHGGDSFFYFTLSALWLASRLSG